MKVFIILRDNIILDSINTVGTIKPNKGNITIK
jgi:hypothetical protein